jgi:hypothetical protein
MRLNLLSREEGLQNDNVVVRDNVPFNWRVLSCESHDGRLLIKIEKSVN